MKMIRPLVLASLVLPLIAQAHPGHDGDHELIWDFEHLSSHPLATILSFGILVAAIWGVRQFVQSRRAKAEVPVRRR